MIGIISKAIQYVLLGINKSFNQEILVIIPSATTEEKRAKYSATFA